MVQVQDICVFLEKFAPGKLAETWDNVGLLLGRRDAPVRRIMTCLTLTQAVAAEAVKRDVQLIVTHHPILFRGAKRLTDRTAEGRIVLTLIESGIAVFSPHTSYDSAGQGINQQLAEQLGLRGIAPIRANSDLPGLGAGRWGILETAEPASEFLGKVMEVTGATFLQTTLAGPDRIQRVAIACGAASEFLDDAVRCGCDTFVTGEARFHSILEAQAAGVNLILTGHYPSERPAVEELAGILGEQFPGITCFASEEDRDPVTVYVAS